MESLLSEYHQELYRYGSGHDLLASSTSSVPPYLRSSARQRYLKDRFQFELRCFSEDCFSGGAKDRLVFAERLPFFHLIGRASLTYEEQERDLQRRQEEERRLKNRSCRRLTSLANSASQRTDQKEESRGKEKNGPQYSYLKDISSFQEESLQGLLELFYSGLAVESELTVGMPKEAEQKEEKEEKILGEEEDEEMRF